MELALPASDTMSATRTEWRPQMFIPASDADRREINAILMNGSWLEIHDTIKEQTQEVIRARKPSTTFTKEELDQEARNIRQSDSPSEHGLWVYFPWSRCWCTPYRSPSIIFCARIAIATRLHSRTEPTAVVYDWYCRPISG
jgi:hypothetical protein